MKYRYPFRPVFLLAALLVFASCRRDYTCVCTVAYDGMTYTRKYDIPKSKRLWATLKCEEYGWLAEEEVKTDPFQPATAVCAID